jgi:DNA processing protein
MNPPSRPRHLYFQSRRLAHENKIPRPIKPEEPIHIDQLVEMLETEMSSSEIFTALFEPELNGMMRQLPGKNFVKSL